MKLFRFLCTMVLVLSIAAVTNAHEPGPYIEITEVRNVGVSAVNQSRSIVQVSWVTENTPTEEIQSFDVKLEVIYADGGVERSSVKASGNIRSNRFEVSTSHRLGSNPAAEIKGFRVSITATYSLTATKQILL